MFTGMKPWVRERRGSQAGVTLIELLISMIILALLTTMLVMVWIDLQRASVTAIAANDERGSVRDALARTTSELKDSQPTAFPTQTPTPTSTPVSFTVAQPMEADFYSAFNNPNAVSDGTGTAASAVELTRIYLDTSGTTPQKTLYWQRDTNGNGSFDSGDRIVKLATNVVNNSITNTQVSPTTSYTAIFTYWYFTGAPTLAKTDTITGSNLAQIEAVQVRLIEDNNLNKPPVPVDLTATVRLRNHN